MFASAQLLPKCGIYPQTGFSHWHAMAARGNRNKRLTYSHPVEERERESTQCPQNEMFPAVCLGHCHMVIGLSLDT